MMSSVKRMGFEMEWKEGKKTLGSDSLDGCVSLVLKEQAVTDGLLEGVVEKASIQVGFLVMLEETEENRELPFGEAHVGV